MWHSCISHYFNLILQFLKCLVALVLGHSQDNNNKETTTIALQTRTSFPYRLYSPLRQIIIINTLIFVLFCRLIIMSHQAALKTALHVLIVMSLLVAIGSAFRSLNSNPWLKYKALPQPEHHKRAQLYGNWRVLRRNEDKWKRDHEDPG